MILQAITAAPMRTAGLALQISQLILRAATAASLPGVGLRGALGDSGRLFGSGPSCRLRCLRPSTRCAPRFSACGPFRTLPHPAVSLAADFLGVDAAKIRHKTAVSKFLGNFFSKIMQFFLKSLIIMSYKHRFFALIRNTRARLRVGNPHSTIF